MTRCKVKRLMRTAGMLAFDGALVLGRVGCGPARQTHTRERSRADARRERPGRQARPGMGVSIRTGQDAPDVALYPLTMTTDANGVEVAKVGETKVRLSDYKGKAPIVIFSSSYT